MNESKSQSKKRKKNYYKSCAKKSSRRVLEPGMKGFLLTCNQREKPCVREAYNLLNEYADELYGNGGKSAENGGSPSAGGAANSDRSFEDELRCLKELAKSPCRFQQVNTKTKNVLFIETQIDDPCRLVLSILKDLQETRKQKCRYLFRIIPVTVTCKGHLPAVEKAAEKLVDEFVKQNNGPVSFTVIVKIRNNNSLKKEDIVSVFLNLVKGKEIPWTPTLKDSQLVICVEVIQTVCCMSILKDYFTLKKYNLIEIAKSGSDKVDASEATTEPCDDEQTCGD